MGDIQLYDLIQAPTDKVYQLFLNCLEQLNLQSKDIRKSNYTNLTTEYKNFASFTVLIQNHTCIAFSGLQTDIFPNMGRVLTRTYYNPEIRANNLKPREFPSYATRLMLPWQVQVAQQLELSHVFISFERGRFKNGLYPKRLASQLNEIDEGWCLLPGFYNTCRPLKTGAVNQDPGCWQYIISRKLSLKEMDFGLPKSLNQSFGDNKRENN